MRTITRLIIHHSASNPQKTTIEDIDGWHRAKGWRCVGYHYVIEQDGSVHVGRQLDEQGAHCDKDDANSDSLGICVTGDNTSPNTAWHWNADQRRALHGLVVSLREVFNVNLPVLGHRDVPGTATECPGVSMAEIFGN